MNNRTNLRSVDIQTTALLISTMLGCVVTARSDAEETEMKYRVTRAPQSVAFDSDWNGQFWQSSVPLELNHFMGQRPEHFPRVQARLMYDERAIYVIFRVDDRYVRAVARQHQDAVWRDSCVEFFFTPNADAGTGYFNLEMNCGGTMLLHCQRAPGEDVLLISAADIAQIEVKHSLPKIVDPEITDETLWTVAYRFPLETLGRYFPAEVCQPDAGVTWRANLYKCADGSSHPHWLTWSPVEFERPDFHRPQSFGLLMFE